MNPQPKFDYIRSPALLKACRDIPCQHCGADNGTVVAAHSNQSKHGKGRSIKASDIYVASLCHTCHHALDQSPVGNRNWRERMWTAAHIKTIEQLTRLGKWPAGVPTPEEA